MTTPVPGPPASVLSAILVANPNDNTGGAMSVAIFSQSGEAPSLPSLTNDVVAMPQDALLDADATFTGFLSTLGLTGATAPARWVGSTTAGPPQSPNGPFSVGDFVVSGDGNVYVCTVAGSAGTWVASGSTVTGTASGDLSGTYPGPNVANAHLATQSISGTATLGGTSAAVVLTDTTTAAFTLTLPATPAAGRWFIVVDDTGHWNTHNLTIGRNGKNIDGAASNVVLSAQWGKVWLYYDGTAWWTISSVLGSGSGVTSVTATDTSIVVGGTGSAPTVATGTLDVIAADHPPAANWSNNSHKITSLANGSAAQDAAAFGQIPVVPAASVNFKPSNPTGTTSATEVMMGLGTTCTYTPTGSGKVIVTITGLFTMTGGAGNVILDPKFGTGTAPANAAAASGTSFGNGGAAYTPHVGGATNLVPFAFTDRLSLTVSTTYWFDTAIASVGGTNTASIQNVSVTIAEQLS